MQVVCAVSFSETVFLAFGLLNLNLPVLEMIELLARHEEVVLMSVCWFAL
jgi:hypothetical protein